MAEAPSFDECMTRLREGDEEVASLIFHRFANPLIALARSRLDQCLLQKVDPEDVLHKQTFKKFWAWSDAVQDTAILTGKLKTVFGWTVHVGNDATPRSLRKFPMQANGAEIMRLACCEATEKGIGVCCPVHNALLIEAPTNEIETAVEATQAVMQKASEIVLEGFPLRTEAKIVRHPERYSDKRGKAMWEIVCELCGRAA